MTLTPPPATPLAATPPLAPPQLSDLPTRTTLAVLASTLAAYPEDDDLACLLDLCADYRVATQARALAPAAWDAATSLIASASTDPEVLGNWRHEYITLFDRRGGNSLYETEYGRERAWRKSLELADLKGFYQAYGLDGGQRIDMPDHLAVELEFLSWLLLKEGHLATLGDPAGVTEVRRGRKLFLEEHLGRLTLSLAQRPGIKAHAIYGPISVWLAAVVANECAHLGAAPTALELLEAEAEPEAFDCACPAAKAAIGGAK